ncbi:MAG: hypothetical protein MJY78_09960 [Fibrobacter sp.]|nr:hypothetical protein [Fibrobacter sp.]
MKKKNLILAVAILTAMASTFTACGGDTFTDPRDGQKYKTVKIGDQVWMAENIAFKTTNSICYLDDDSECSNGRYYPFSVALAVCPEGWHLPSKSEAAKFINKLIKEKRDLKSTHGWYDSRTENFESTMGDVLLLTSTYGHVIEQLHDGIKPEIWEASRIGRFSDKKIAVRCVTDAEYNKEE